MSATWSRGDETCVFALEDEDDGTAPHQYGPSDEFYYILEGEFTVWWGKDASKLDNCYKLGKGDCTYYPTGWKYKVGKHGRCSRQVPLLHVGAAGDRAEIRQDELTRGRSLRRGLSNHACFGFTAGRSRPVERQDRHDGRRRDGRRCGCGGR